jgi:Zn-dependent protease
MAEITNVIGVLLAMIFSLSFHEAAHAWMAKRCGDRTAESMGRLTLNPLAHIDPVGTVLLPIIGSLTNLPVIGWAKPVPVDLRNLKNEKRDHFFIAFAGPVSNLILCAVCVVIYFVFELKFSEMISEKNFFYPLISIVQQMIGVNAMLAVFNMIPLPPLDGATVFSALLPDQIAERYQEIVAPYGIFILFGLMYFGMLLWVGPVARAYINMLYGVLSVALL